MPISYKVKLIMGGATGSSKASFLHKNTYNEEDFFQIGVSFIPLECVMNNGNSFVFIIWELNSKDRFRFMYPKFCKGASGGLLCFDLSNHDSFEELESWIDIFKTSAGEIPIILIGTETMEGVREVSMREIEDFTVKHQIDSLFFTSVSDENKIQKKTAIFKRLIKKIDPSINKSSDFSVTFPMEEDKFQEFVENFSICPICKKENHPYNLKNFYYSDDAKVVQIKLKLLDLFEKSQDLQDSYSNNIIFGIPCCRCHKKIWNEKKP